MAVTVACAFGAVVVLPLARPPTAGLEAAGALAVDAWLCLMLAVSHRLPDSQTIHHARAAVVFLVGLIAGVPGWFFGSFSGFSAVVVLAIMLAGTVSGASRHRRPSLPGWMTYAGLALGQALAFVLPFTGVIGDRSLAPIFFYFKEPKANQVFSHLAVQAIFVVAFLAARAFQRKYRELAEEVDAAERAAAVRDALLEEARADYMRALLAGRRAETSSPRTATAPAPSSDEPPTLANPAVTRLLSPEAVDGARQEPPVEPSRQEPPVEQSRREQPVDDASWLSTVPLSPQAGDEEEPAVSEPAPSAPPPSAPQPLGGPREAELKWASAYRDKMRRQLRVVTAAAAFGCVVVARIAHYPIQVWVGCISMAAAVAVAWYQWRLDRNQQGETIYWPWVIIAALSVGPSYAFGFHSSFAAVITALLFLGGLFRARQHAYGMSRRIVVLAALCLSQLSAFLLVFSGVVPDIGNVPIRLDGTARYEPLIAHLLLQGIYISAFVAGWAVDRRYDTLMRRAAAAAHERIKQEEMLQTARAAIDRVQQEEGEGIFANHKVGRFELRRLCARGGMGDVYEAVEQGTDRKVAVKLVRYDRAADPLMLRLFVTEAIALARVQSPHVAQVLGAGGLEQELPYVAMEFIDGPPLSKVLRERRLLPLPEVCALIRDAAFGLAAIHHAGIVHRDVKPQNIMMSSVAGSWCWKIVDLGVAQTRVDRSAAASATASLIIGTPQYMSPEQALGEAIDARSDLYSLCLVGYRALTGRPALIARDHSSVARIAQESALPSPRWFVPLVPDLEYVFRIGLASRPKDRFGTAEELAAAFDDAARGALDESLRRHARRLLEREPWGGSARTAMDIDSTGGTTSVRRGEQPDAGRDDRTRREL